MNNERLCDHTLFMRSILVLCVCEFSQVMFVGNPCGGTSSPPPNTHHKEDCELQNWPQKLCIQRSGRCSDRRKILLSQSGPNFAFMWQDPPTHPPNQRSRSCLDMGEETSFFVRAGSACVSTSAKCFLFAVRESLAGLCSFQIHRKRVLQMNQMVKVVS